VQFYISLQYYNFQASLNHRANACSCLFFLWNRPLSNNWNASCSWGVVKFCLHTDTLVNIYLKVHLYSLSPKTHLCNNM
jgi:hypothetical protein